MSVCSRRKEEKKRVLSGYRKLKRKVGRGERGAHVRSGKGKQNIKTEAHAKPVGLGARPARENGKKREGIGDFARQSRDCFPQASLGKRSRHP